MLYQLLYQITPIFLTNGIAQNQAGNILPIMTILNPAAFDVLFQGASSTFNMDNFFAIFQPAPGGSLVKQQIAEYPFANLNVAANAIIRDAIDVSMIMMTPMKTPNAWAVKNATMTALKATLDTHNNLGGTYTVFTPAFTYYDMVMIDLIDISTSASPLPQNTWRWDFRKPLVTLADIIAAENNLYSKITAGVPSSSEWTSTLTAMGVPASTVNQAAGAGSAAVVPNLIGATTPSQAPS